MKRSTAMGLACFLLLVSTNVAAAQSDPGTFVLHPASGPPVVGFIIAVGDHKGKFNPCNTSDYLDIADKDLSPHGPRCPASNGGDPHPQTALNSTAFSAAKTINTTALQQFLTQSASAAASLLKYTNSDAAIKNPNLMSQKFNVLYKM